MSVIVIYRIVEILYMIDNKPGEFKRYPEYYYVRSLMLNIFICYVQGSNGGH